MRKVLFATLCLLLFIVNIDIVNASSCDSADIERLKVLASNVTYNSDYIGDTDMTVSTQTYNVNFVGITDELYISYYPTYSYDRVNIYNDNQTVQIESGSTIFGVFSSKCNVKLRDISVDLLKFNEYSTYNVCQQDGIKELNVCSPWYQGEINDEIFDATILDYENSLQSESSFSDNIKDFFVNNYIYFIVGAVCLVIIIIIFIIIRVRKNRLY